MTVHDLNIVDRYRSIGFEGQVKVRFNRSFCHAEPAEINDIYTDLHDLGSGCCWTESFCISAETAGTAIRAMARVMNRRYRVKLPAPFA